VDVWLLPATAGAFWIGILLAGLPAHGPGVAWGAVALSLGLAAVAAARVWLRAIRGRKRSVLVVLLPVVAFALLGGGWAELRAARIRASPLASLVGRSVRIQGVVGSPPESGALGWTMSMRAEVVLPGTAEWPSAIAVRDSLWVEGRGRPPPLQPGERIVIRGPLHGLRGSFGDYLRHRGYPASVFVEHLDELGQAAGPLQRTAQGLRAALRDSLGRVFPAREAGLLMGLTLGDTSRLDPRIEEDFRATGLSHLTAVSGENLAMFLGPILGLAMWLRVGRWGRLAIGFLAVGFFVLLTGAEPSVLRAAAMSGLTLLGVFLGRPRSAPAIMGGAVLLLLAVNPTLVYSIGFQLSVAATAGMAFLAGPLSDMLRSLPKGLALAAGTTLGAQAGVTPLLLYHFGVVPTVSVPANLLAFPAVGPGMLLGLIAGGAGLASRSAGLLIAAMARVPLGYLEGLSARLARSPLPWITSTPGRLLVLFAGVAVAAGLGWWVRSGRRLPRRVAVAACLAMPVFVWSSALRAGPPSSLTVVFFDVGQGDSALVRSPGGAAILIDGGPDHELVAAKLAGLGIRRLDMIVATHPHADHVGGLAAVLGRFGVALVIDPGCPGDSPFYTEFLSAVEAAGVPLRHPGAGTVLVVGDVRLEVLGPEGCFVGTNSDPNNDSLILRVSEGDASILFPGDAEQPSQSDVIRDRIGELTALVLKVPHHGGDTSLPSFLMAVSARVAIVSVGPNRYGHPSPTVIAELAADGMRVFRTDQWGDITVTIRHGDVLVSGDR
jgi:competence protein ComEC